MKKFLSVISLIFVCIFTITFAAPAYATSQQAYQDYLFQFDQYRQKYSDFQVAKNAYDKFKSLESETTALSATKIMLAQRDQLLRAYLLYLFERVTEQQGITTVNKQLSFTLLTNELAFLEKQSNLVPSINSIDDAITASKQLESHYRVLSATIRQIIAGISLGQLNVITQNFDRQVTVAQTFFTQNSATFSTQKQATINNWVLQITNKRSLYQQKIDEINVSVSGLSTSHDITDLDRKFSEIIKKIGEAKQYMADCIAGLHELSVALQYIN